MCRGSKHGKIINCPSLHNHFFPSGSVFFPAWYFQSNHIFSLSFLNIITIKILIAIWYFTCLSMYTNHITAPFWWGSKIIDPSSILNLFIYFSSISYLFDTLPLDRTHPAHTTPTPARAFLFRSHSFHLKISTFIVITLYYLYFRILLSSDTDSGEERERREGEKRGREEREREREREREIIAHTW